MPPFLHVGGAYSGMGRLLIRRVVMSLKREVHVLGVGVCFTAATIVLYVMAASLAREGPPLSFPTNLDQLRSLASQLQKLKEDHYSHVLCLFAAAYLYKQTFAIPGSVFLNILGGAVFGVWVALPLVCVLTACGASLCYLLSWAFGRAVVTKYLGHRIAPIQDRLRSSHGVDLLVVLLSLRLFPMSPNWLLNLTSPLVGVPVPLFFISVLFGLLPYNFLCVQAGLMLAELRGVAILDPTSIALLLLGAVLLLATGLGMRYLYSKLERNITR